MIAGEESISWKILLTTSRIINSSATTNPALKEASPYDLDNPNREIVTFIVGQGHVGG